MTWASKAIIGAFVLATGYLGASPTPAHADNTASPAPSGTSCVASVVRAGGPDEAAKAVAFAPPALETRYLISSGGYFQVASVDGMTVTTVNASNHTVAWLGGLIDVPRGTDKAAVEAIWPLEIGKTVTFLEQSGKDAWCHTVSILRAESINVQAGKFDTIVIAERLQSLRPEQGNLDVTRTYWYAPSVHWAVKRAVKQVSGPPYSYVSYELNQIVTAASRPPTIDRHWVRMACSDAPIDVPFSQGRDCYRGPIGKGDDGLCHVENYGTAGHDNTMEFEIYLAFAGGRCGVYFAGNDILEFTQTATAMSRNGLDFSPLKRVDAAEVLSFTGRGRKGPLGCFAFARIGPVLRHSENLYRYAMRGHICRDDGTTPSDADIAALVRGISVE